jgi:hypothetical protein
MISENERQLRETREDLSNSKEELRFYQEKYRVALPDMERITKDVEFLMIEYTRHASTIEALKATPLPPQQTAQLTELGRGTSGMALQLRSISERWTTLSAKIEERLEPKVTTDATVTKRPSGSNLTLGALF